MQCEALARGPAQAYPHRLCEWSAQVHAVHVALVRTETVDRIGTATAVVDSALASEDWSATATGRVGRQVQAMERACCLEVKRVAVVAHEIVASGVYHKIDNASARSVRVVNRAVVLQQARDPVQLQQAVRRAVCSVVATEGAEV